MKTKAPIDNKHILVDFTNDFHHDSYIERICNGVTYQAFYLNDCLCEISYRHGDNWFKVRVVEGNAVDVQRCYSDFKRITDFYNEDVALHRTCVEYKPFLGVYEFYFVES